MPLAKRLLARAMQASGWSQEAVAMELRVTRRTVQGWWANHVPPMPRME